MFAVFGKSNKGRPKSKTPDERYPQPCPNSYHNLTPHHQHHQQQQQQYAYQPQPAAPPPIHIQQAQTYTQQVQYHHAAHQPMQPMSIIQQPPACPHQCQSQNIMQSPQQSVTYPVHNQFRGHTMEARPAEQAAIILNNQIQAPMPQVTQQFVPMPTYQNNQAHSVLMNNVQPSRYSNNNYYSNQVAPQQQQQQINHQQQRFQIDEQRQRVQQQQQQQQNNQQLSHSNGIQKQQSVLQQQQQQQYQNHQMVEEFANVHIDGDLSLEVLCDLHDRDTEELLKLASSLKGDLKKLGEELEIIRQETPEYSVSEVKI